MKLDFIKFSQTIRRKVLNLEFSVDQGSLNLKNLIILYENLLSFDSRIFKYCFVRFIERLQDEPPHFKENSIVTFFILYIQSIRYFKST